MPLPKKGQAQTDLPRRLLTALSKAGQVLRSQTRPDLHALQLTPTQAEILNALAAARGEEKRLGDVARTLGVRAPTASEAVAALIRKKLVRRTPATDDGRAIALELTPRGARIAEQAAEWPQPFVAAVSLLDPREQALLLANVVRVLRCFEAAGLVAAVRMCPGCENFRRGAHTDPDRPHHCALLDVALGDGDVRFDCALHRRAAAPHPGEP
jgi:DNA-binding MarR family transcriptional regulator